MTKRELAHKRRRRKEHMQRASQLRRRLLEQGQELREDLSMSEEPEQILKEQRGGRRQTTIEATKEASLSSRSWAREEEDAR